MYVGADPTLPPVEGDTPGAVGICDYAEPISSVRITDYMPADANYTPAYPYGFPGGRIPVSERVDPGAAGLLNIDRYGEDPKPHERVFKLTPEALAAFRGLRGAAMAAGFNKELFTLTSAYRSAGHQAELARGARRKYGNRGSAGRWVAQGKSEHITGRAFDLNLGISNSSENAKSGAFEHVKAYEWLKVNAPFFGLSPYSEEPWHWSYNPRNPQ